MTFQIPITLARIARRGNAQGLGGRGISCLGYSSLKLPRRTRLSELVGVILPVLIGGVFRVFRMAGMLKLRRMSAFGLVAFCMCTCCWMRLTARVKRAALTRPFGERGEAGPTWKSTETLLIILILDRV